MSPTLDELYDGMISINHAANVAEMQRVDLVNAATKEGIDTKMGFDIDDLIRLLGKLSVMSYEPERKAKLRSAMQRFVEERDNPRSRDGR